MENPDNFPMVTYEKPERIHDDVLGQVEDEAEVEIDTDPLLEHISSTGLPLKLRPPTLSDGNCWYDAMADQVRNSLLLAYLWHLLMILSVLSH